MESVNINIAKPETITEESMYALLKNIGDGYTLRAMRGLSDAEMEAVYSMGINFYNAGNYADAEKVFKFLVMFDHLSSRYWTAMGSLRQAQRRFEEAIEAYKFASFLDLHNPRPIYYSAECYLALGKKEEALDAIAGLDEFGDKTSESGRSFIEKGAKLRAMIEQ